MAQSDVIKEFLVGLGYKVDEDGQKKFTSGVDRATQAVQSLTRAGAAAAVAIAAGINEMSERLETLYYISSRSNATVANLQGIQYAAGQIGVGADAATAAVQNLARSIYLQPGNEGLIASLGVQTRDANGQLRDTTKIAVDLISRLKSMGPAGSVGFAIAAQYAQALGIDADTLLLMTKNLDELTAAQERHQKRLAAAGLDADKVAEQSKNIQNALRDLGSELDVFGGLLVRDFYDPAMQVIGAAKDLVAWINSLSQVTDGWSTRIAAVSAAILGWKAAMLGARGALSFVGMSPAAAVAGGTGAGVVGGAVARLAPWAAFLAAMEPTSLNEGEDEAVRKRNEEFEQQRSGMFSGESSKERAMNYFMGKGWSREQAAGIVANLMRESNLDPAAVGDGGKAYGLAQWHPDRQKKLSEHLGEDIKGTDFYRQLGLVDFELRQRPEGKELMGATSAEEAARIVSEKYERPANRADEAAVRARMAAELYSEGGGTGREGRDGRGSDVSISQRTEINVYGAGDPAAAGNAVVGAQDRVNGDLVRNTRGAIR